MIRYLSEQNVFDASLDRIRFIFNEFENIMVYVSGGKDSTVTLEMSLIVAREMNRLPLNVCWLDQEAEWQGTVDTIREIMYRPEVKPYWYQIPIRLFNATATKETGDSWLHCWDEKDKARWVHPQDPISIKENKLGTDRFKEALHRTLVVEFNGERAAGIGGVRVEESPARMVGLTTHSTYKHITWGNKVDKVRGIYNFYPLYDWTYADIWKAIHSNGWKYNPVYDKLFALGNWGIRDLRISNLHHETAVTTLFELQEIEPRTYERVIRRVAGADSAGNFVRERPYMFGTWAEYIDYLIDNLMEPENAKEMRRQIRLFEQQGMVEEWGSRIANAVLANDWTGTKLQNLRVAKGMRVKREWKAVQKA